MTYRKKLILRIIILTALVFILYNVALQISRIGERAVEIKSIPKDSEIYLGEKKLKAGTNYLSDGEYVFTAKKEYFTDDTKKIVVNEDLDSVVLVPGIDSPEAEDYFLRNPDEAKERERYFGEEIVKRDVIIQNNYPIIGLLPIDDLIGPFSIDYGTEDYNPEEIFLIVSNSSPGGRVAALKWIRQNGQDPTDLRIEFKGFENPLSGGGQ